MAKNEIIEKINSVLLKHNAYTECEIVYLMVQFRKLLELSEKKDKYHILKFYADWVVHCQKDKIPEPAENFFNEINNSVTDENKYYQNIIDKFFTCEELKKELLEFFTEFQINTAIIDDMNKWISFSSKLIHILINQPINDPHPKIKRICFEQDDEEDVLRFVMAFKDKRDTWMFRTRWKL